VPDRDRAPQPPLLTWFSGRQPVARFVAENLLTGPGRLRLVAVMANGQPAFAVYQRDPGGAYHAHAVQVLTVTTTGIARIVAFQNPGLFGSFTCHSRTVPRWPGPRQPTTRRTPRGPAEQGAGAARVCGRLCARRRRDGDPAAPVAPHPVPGLGPGLLPDPGGWDLGYYPILDRAPKGRDEGDGWQLWIRRHDEYVEDSPPASPIGGRLLRSGRGDR
jgi:hypothetical protein